MDIGHILPTVLKTVHLQVKVATATPGIMELALDNIQVATINIFQMHMVHNLEMDHLDPRVANSMVHNTHLDIMEVLLVLRVGFRHL